MDLLEIHEKELLNLMQTRDDLMTIVTNIFDSEQEYDEERIARVLYGLIELFDMRSDSAWKSFIEFVAALEIEEEETENE